MHGYYKSKHQFYLKISPNSSSSWNSTLNSSEYIEMNDLAWAIKYPIQPLLWSNIYSKLKTKNPTLYLLKSSDNNIISSRIINIEPVTLYEIDRNIFYNNILSKYQKTFDDYLIKIDDDPIYFWEKLEKDKYFKKYFIYLINKDHKRNYNLANNYRLAHFSRRKRLVISSPDSEAPIEIRTKLFRGATLEDVERINKEYPNITIRIFFERSGEFDEAVFQITTFILENIVE
jgi:hypothetical protein